MKFGMVGGLANPHLAPKFGELWHTFLGAKVFHGGYLADFYGIAIKFGSIKGIGRILVNFGPLFSRAQIFDSRYLRHFLLHGDEIWQG